jgi:hypothetical protein
MTDDDELMREIRAQFERAKEAAPKPIDALALATHLGARFEHALRKSGRRLLTIGKPTACPTLDDA